MGQEEKDSSSALPVLPRLDRLDHLLQILEEKHGLAGGGQSSSSRPVVRKIESEAHLKTLSNALEEVHHKGTLIQRLEMLEKRVLQLSIEMDEGNTSGSSSSTVPVSENFGHGSGLSSVTNEDEDITSHALGSLLIQDSWAQPSVTKTQISHNGKKQKGKSFRKWQRWIRMGC